MVVVDDVVARNMRDAVCCSVVQCCAVCCSAWKSVTVRFSDERLGCWHCSVLQFGAVLCSVWQCVALVDGLVAYDAGEAVCCSFV